MLFDKRSKIEKIVNKPDEQKAIDQYVNKLKRIKVADPQLMVAIRRIEDGKHFNMKWGQIEKLSPQTLQKYEFIGSLTEYKGNKFIGLIWIPLFRKFEKMKRGEVK